MRFDLTTDIAEKIAHAKFNLELGAEFTRNKVMSQGERIDSIDANTEAQQFLVQQTHPGPWVSAEASASQISNYAAASNIIARHFAWRQKAAAIGQVIRTTEVKLASATHHRDIVAIMAAVKWPVFVD